jgi:hypothetical protein
MPRAWYSWQPGLWDTGDSGSVAASEGDDGAQVTPYVSP